MYLQLWSRFFQSWSLKRQAGAKEKREAAGGGHSFFFNEFPDTSLCLESQGREREGGGTWWGGGESRYPVVCSVHEEDSGRASALTGLLGSFRTKVAALLETLNLFKYFALFDSQMV